MRPLAVVLGAAVLALVLAGCGDKVGTTVPGADTASPSVSVTPGSAGLVFTRSDGSTFVLSDVSVSCRTSTSDDKTRVVKMISPARESEVSAKEPYFYAEVVPGTHGEFPLPLGAGSLAKAPPVLFFTYDPTDQNELSADMEESRGTVTVLQATCDPVPRLSLVLAGSVGSEYGDLPQDDVTGHVSAGGGS